MISTKEIIQKQKPIATATVSTKIKPIAIEDKHIDLLINENNDILCLDFKAWYCKCIKLIGADKFVQLASQARNEGKNKPKYFSWLLKREIN